MADNLGFTLPVKFDYQAGLNELQARINELRNTGVSVNLNQTGVSELNTQISNVINSTNNLNTSLNQVNSTLTNIRNTGNRSNFNPLGNPKDLQTSLNLLQRGLNIQIDAAKRRYSHVGGAERQLEDFRNVVNGLTVENGRYIATINNADGSTQKYAVSARELRMQMREVRNSINEAIGPFDNLRYNLLKFSQYFFGGGLIAGITNAIKQSASYAVEMDKYMTNVRIITGQSAQEVSNLTNEYIELGKAMGSTSQQVAQIAEDFYRQGRSAAETQELIRSTLMMANLSGMGASESTEYMTSIMNGFKMDVNEAEDVVSKLVAVDNSAATSVEELAVALARCSNTAQSVGVDFDTLVGYIGTVSSTTRKSAETIGELFA